MNFSKRSRLLAILAAVFFIIASLNALEYFFAGINWLDRFEGEISEVEHQTYWSSRGKYSDYYSKTKIKLANSDKHFELGDWADEGGFIPVEKGDTIVLYVKRWYQNAYIFTFNTNIYLVEKNGAVVYNNLSAWKGAAFGTMCLTSGLAVFLFIIYLAVAKNISVEHWFQGRILKNPKYLKATRRDDPSLK